LDHFIEVLEDLVRYLIPFPLWLGKKIKNSKEANSSQVHKYGTGIAVLNTFRAVGRYGRRREECRRLDTSSQPTSASKRTAPHLFIPYIWILLYIKFVKF
jgi:hypothetical protein